MIPSFFGRKKKQLWTGAYKRFDHVVLTERRVVTCCYQHFSFTDLGKSLDILCYPCARQQCHSKCALPKSQWLPVWSQQPGIHANLVEPGWPQEASSKHSQGKGSQDLSSSSCRIASSVGAPSNTTLQHEGAIGQRFHLG